MMTGRSRTYPRCRRLRGPTIAARQPSVRMSAATFRARLARAGSGIASASNTSLVARPHEVIQLLC
jgi:hypothetical protein